MRGKLIDKSARELYRRSAEHTKTAALFYRLAQHMESIGLLHYLVVEQECPNKYVTKFRCIFDLVQIHRSDSTKYGMEGSKASRDGLCGCGWGTCCIGIVAGCFGCVDSDEGIGFFWLNCCSS